MTRRYGWRKREIYRSNEAVEGESRLSGLWLSTFDPDLWATLFRTFGWGVMQGSKRQIFTNNFGFFFLLFSTEKIFVKLSWNQTLLPANVDLLVVSKDPNLLSLHAKGKRKKHTAVLFTYLMFSDLNIQRFQYLKKCICTTVSLATGSLRRYWTSTLNWTTSTPR